MQRALPKRRPHTRVISVASSTLTTDLKQQSPSSTPTPNLDKVYTVDDFQRLAKEILPKPIYEYISSGSDDEQTLRENRAGFKRLALRPRALSPVHGLSCAVPNFCGTGTELSLPVFASPAGVHQVVHEAGECATARACGTVGTVFSLSQHSTKSIEEVSIAAPSAQRWYQAYLLKDRDCTVDLVQRALLAGSRGIFLTVDSVRFGFREADARNQFSGLPPGLGLANYAKAPPSDLCNGAVKSEQHSAWDQNTEAIFDQRTSWDDVRWLRGIVNAAAEKYGLAHIPFVLKGILTAEDASAAVHSGADGVMVSTHGGRQLDSTLSAIGALPEVVKAVRALQPDPSKFTVLLDSGVRRGTDVVKALALGASAVGVGKPLFFALAVGGEQGVQKLFNILRVETETAMALCGCRTVADIHPGLVQNRANL